MKRFNLLWICIFCTALLTPSVAATWSFHGGYIYFDNTLTGWNDTHFMLIIGDNGWSSVRDMEPDTVPGRYKCMLPLRGWSNATYMAVIADCYTWDTGAWDKNNLQNAIHYTAAYTAGLASSAGQGFLLSPQSSQNGTQLSLTYLGTGHKGRKFTTREKNNCQRLEGDTAITIIFPTASSRFNQPFVDVKKIYMYGPISMWQNMEEYRLNRFSEDSCYYRTFPLSEVERPGNSGQPEFRFKVYKTDGSKYEDRAHAGWECGIDYRLVMINRSETMMMLLPGDDIEELGERRNAAIDVRSLADWGVIDGDSVKEAQISNFRRVPATRYLYRSYHPYNPNSEYDTEAARFYYLAKNATRVGIQSDICLGGDMSDRVGQTYRCGNTTQTIAIPDYYAPIMANGNVLIVGTENGHIPDYNTCLYQTDKRRYGQWLSEIADFVIDEQHPLPMQIHCALGGDRTGAVAATIAALCGASWEEIVVDYEATSDLKIQQYRHRNLLRYCFRQMLGENPDEIEDLQSAMRQYLMGNGYLTAAQIDGMVARLTGADTPTALSSTPEQQSSASELQPATKVLQAGHLYIQRAGARYSTTGIQIQ